MKNKGKFIFGYLRKWQTREIVFRNDDWIFSRYEDPIILFLPERFFLQCALIIVATVLLGCIYFVIRYFYRKEKIN